MRQIAMEAPLLLSAFPSLLQGTPKILVGGQAECLFKWSQGREKVFHSHNSDGGWLRPSPALCWTHAQASPLILLFEQPYTCTWIKAGWGILSPKYQVEQSVAFPKGWLEKPHLSCSPIEACAGSEGVKSRAICSSILLLKC